jgi:hypothetical protein
VSNNLIEQLLTMDLQVQERMGYVVLVLTRGSIPHSPLKIIQSKKLYADS